MSKILYINSDRLGSGSDELGKLLIRNFLNALLEEKSGVTEIILINGGVKLACEGSHVLDLFDAFANAGADISACGTCLDFFNVRDKLKSGAVTNMKSIAAKVSNKENFVIRP